MKSRRHNFDTKSTGTTSTDHACTVRCFAYVYCTRAHVAHVIAHVLVHMLFRYYNSGSDTHVFAVLHIYVRSVATEQKSS